MDKKGIIFLIVMVVLPFGGIFMLAKGIINNYPVQIVAGAICCVLWIAMVVAISYVQNRAKRQKLSVEEKERREKGNRHIETEKEKLDRERIEREKQEIREREQKSIEYLNEHKHSLVNKYSEAVFNFIEKLTDTYPYFFFKDV